VAEIAPAGGGVTSITGDAATVLYPVAIEARSCGRCIHQRMMTAVAGGTSSVIEMASVAITGDAATVVYPVAIEARSCGLGGRANNCGST